MACVRQPWRGSCNLCVKPAGGQRGEKSSPGQTRPSTQPSPGTNLKVTWVALEENSHEPPQRGENTDGWGTPPHPFPIQMILIPLCITPTAHLLSPAGWESSPDRHHLSLAVLRRCDLGVCYLTSLCCWFLICKKENNTTSFLWLSRGFLHHPIGMYWASAMCRHCVGCWDYHCEQDRIPDLINYSLNVEIVNNRIITPWNYNSDRCYQKRRWQP